jgi:hypothetical protein
MKDSQIEGRNNFIIMLLGLEIVSRFVDLSSDHNLTSQPLYRTGRGPQDNRCIAGRGALDPVQDDRDGRCLCLFYLGSIWRASVPFLETIVRGPTDRR